MEAHESPMNARTSTIIDNIRRRIARLREAKAALLDGGVASASMGSGGASQSYTRLKVEDYDREIARLETMLSRLRRGGRFMRRTAPDFLLGNLPDA